MHQLFQPGATKTFSRLVSETDTAVFNNETVHPVYATFAVARDAEWCCRQFVLEMKEADEEGIGTMVSVEHHAPALVGSRVDFTATIASIRDNEILCTYEARVNNRLIACGQQIQKILKKEKIRKIFERQ